MAKSKGFLMLGFFTIALYVSMQLGISRMQFLQHNKWYVTGHLNPMTQESVIIANQFWQAPGRKILAHPNDRGSSSANNTGSDRDKSISDAYPDINPVWYVHEPSIYC
jgi:hypothetical protein